MKEFEVEIVTPARKVYSDKVKMITLPGTEGEFQVLYNHAPLLSTIEVGKIQVMDANDKLQFFATSGGTIEVLKNKVLVLAESVERAEEIDVERAESALKRAQERLASKGLRFDQIRAEFSLARAKNRWEIAKKYKRV